MTRPPLHERSTVCAVIPHYRCEQWLAQSLESLLDQSRPLDAIVVVDDGSGEPPVDIVADHPDVTLLEVDDNGGPYRLIQAVMDATSFDAYVFQDADDWSAPDRLAMLVAGAAEAGAELVGSHEVRVLVEEGDVVPVAYPLDVNGALRERPTSFPLLHPTSIVGRELVRRVGGFASGMRFSGDAEFLRRAAHAARVVNVDHYGYFRRKRPGSLTLGSDTELGSPARLAVQDVLATRARRNAGRVRAGHAPDLTPWRVARAPELRHVLGPPLWPARRTVIAPAVPPARAGSPVFVVGAPRAGQTVLGWALGQHPALRLLPDSRWLARAASDVEGRAGEDAVRMPAGFRAEMASTLSSLAGGDAHRIVAAGTELLGAAHALHQLFPDARFIHVVRDVDDAVAAVTSAPTADGAFFTPDAAWRTWLTATGSGLALEEALGSDVVLRVGWGDLVDDPTSTVRRCLDFLGEADAAACARPLEGLSRSLCTDSAPVADALAERARELSRRAGERHPQRSPDDLARRRLAERFHRDRAARQAAGGSLVERVLGLVEACVPEGSSVAVVSRGDPRLVDLPGRAAWHVPQIDGVYAGHHPADSSEAIGHLDSVRAVGADHLVVPATSLWWLTYYEGLRRHLLDHASLVAFHEEIGAVFRFGAPVAAAIDGKPAAPRFVPEPITWHGSAP